MVRRPHVLVVGGNLAGLRCARALDPACFRVTVVDPGASVEWLPGIHELLSGRRTPEALRLPRRALLAAAGHRHLRARVARLDAAACEAVLDDGATVSWDYAVVAAGGINATRGVPGVEVYAHAFKSVADCAGIHDALSAPRRGPARVVLVGAGIEGVEALGELLPRLRAGSLQLTLVDPAAGFLGARYPGVDRRIGQSLSGLPVACLFGRRVAAVLPDAVVLDDGSRHAADLCIWTGGVAPPPWLRDSGLAGDDGWLPVERTLRVPGTGRLFGAGDIVRFPDALPRQAYHALDMGAHAADGIRRLARGLPLRPFRPAPKPQLVSFGRDDCFLLAGDTAVASPVLGLGKDLVRVAGLALAGDAGDGRGALAAAGRLAPSFARDVAGFVRRRRLLSTLLDTRLLT